MSGSRKRLCWILAAALVGFLLAWLSLERAKPEEILRERGKRTARVAEFQLALASADHRAGAIRKNYERSLREDGKAIEARVRAMPKEELGARLRDYVLGGDGRRARP